MKTIRATLVGLTAAALLGLPGVAMASATGGSAQLTASPATLDLAVTRHRTSVRFLDFAHFHAAGENALVRGQVVGWAQGTHGALGGAQVKLYRQLDGNSTWVYLASQVTDQGSHPAFSFTTLARQNAHYKVTFGGTALFLPSAGTTSLAIYRVFNGVITDGSNVATLHGHVSPYYTHKPIAVQKRSCASCAYVTVKHAVTGAGGVYSFGLPAPATGRWWWRLAIPGTAAYIASYGATFSTQER